MSKVFTITEGLENMGALRTGGQGSVYKGRRMGPIISAVKLLPTPIYAEDEHDKNFRNFQNEVEKLKKVNEVPNPNVVKIINSGITESGSLPFIEMEFIDGPDLEELLKPPHELMFTVKEVIKLADQLANALSHCHKVGVKHGDIKSNNVKFNFHTGNYVLLDFGLAIMSEEQRRTSIRHAGAIEFMAPEQNTGEMLFQTDIYSFGVIIYELLAGQVPFPLQDNGETARNTVMVAHMESPVPDVLQKRMENLPASWPEEKKEREMQVPLWLLNIVNKCLQKAPQNRYAKGTELHEAIIDGSTNTKAAEGTYESILALKEENNHIQAQLLEYQQKEAQANAIVKVPKNTFAGMIVILLAAIAFGAYGLYASKRTATPQLKDTIATSTSQKPVVITPVTSVQPTVTKRVQTTDTSNANPLTGMDLPTRDSIAKAEVSKKPATATIPKKRKRKKFLGIF